jgi:hypothetical protein
MARIETLSFFILAILPILLNSLKRLSEGTASTKAIPFATFAVFALNF